MHGLSRKTLILALLLVLGAWGSLGIAMADFFDGFDVTPDTNWNDMPGWAAISNGILALSPPSQGDGCWITSTSTFTYGTYTMKFRTTVEQGNYIYMGYFSRSPWSNPAAYVRLDGGALVLSAADGTNGNGNAMTTSAITPNVWHTVSIIRRPDAVIVILDGILQGQYTTYVPTQPMPIVIDTTRLLTTPLVFEIDEISVTDSTDVPGSTLLFLDNFDAVSTNWLSMEPWTTISGGMLNINPPAQNSECHITSDRTFQYGTYECKFKTTNNPGNLGYWGYASRSPWMNPAAYARLDQYLNYGVGNGSGGSGGDLTTTTITPGWHTINVIRKLDAVDYYRDGAFLKSITSYVPTQQIPLILDFVRNSAFDMSTQIDYVSVASGTDKPSFKDSFNDNPDNWWVGTSPWATISNGIFSMTPPVPETVGYATSNYLWQYGTFTCKFRQNIGAGNFAYMGGASRDPWFNPNCHVRYQNGKMYLSLADGTAGTGQALETPGVTPNEWHTVKIVRRPTSVWLCYDGQWVGATGQYVPTQAMPLIIDTYRASEEPMTLEVDEVTVTSDDFAPAATEMSLSATKQQADGTHVAFNGGVVTFSLYVESANLSILYVESEDRSSGIRVRYTGQGPAVGAKVNVTGFIRTDTGIAERYIEAYAVNAVGVGDIKPLLMNNKAAGGGDFGTPPAGQPGMTNGVGLNNIGLLVRVYGQVSEIVSSTGQPYYQLDDGSGVYLWVLPIYGTMFSGSYVAATGVMSSVVEEGTVRPLLLVYDTATDVQQQP
ncbi:MAG: hypothetical protein ACYC64_03600 [Armatimonadota bacterium]